VSIQSDCIFRIISAMLSSKKNRFNILFSVNPETLSNKKKHTQKLRGNPISYKAERCVSYWFLDRLWCTDFDFGLFNSHGPEIGLTVCATSRDSCIYLYLLQDLWDWLFFGMFPFSFILWHFIGFKSFKEIASKIKCTSQNISD
jgi:hypothetical protein